MDEPSKPAPSPPDEEAERLRLFIGSVTDYAIYMLAPDGTVASWNAGAQRFKGYTADEIVGQHFSRFYSAEDRAAGVPEGALRTAREQGKFEAEGWRMRKDGTRFWASVVIDPIRNEQGKLVGFAKITRDISDKRATQEALRESEERFRLLVQGVTDYAIYMLSPAGLITNWNAGARRIKGFEHDDVVGTHFSRFYTEDDRANGLPMRALDEAGSKGRFEAEGWRVRKDGTRFWAHVVIDAIRNEAGVLVGFAKITRDITERREAALALEQAREALFRSQKMEAIGKLTGGVAHDFNNLLNVVTNGLSILRARTREPADLRMIDAMEQAAGRGALLTQQLLSFARQQTLNPEARDLNRVIASFEAVLRRGSRAGIQFQVQLAEALPQVMIDAAKFETALLNLVVNARDATPDGGTIAIATGRVDLQAGEVGELGAGSYVAISVQDSGAGMSADVAARAIEPFFTTKEVGKGTGLGLSQVYGMVRQSGGDLSIRSRQGQGTTITMYFPALSGHSESSRHEGDSADKVLIVDDQPDVLEVTCELFRSLGFEVVAANSGEDAIDVLKRTPGIHLMLSDVVMPGMNGVQLGRKAQELVPGLKVILASGFANPAVAAKEDSLQGFEFLPKPYRVGDVVKRLRTLG
ncbi:PAS domain-containing sensor histidine kinase [Ramlibacter sp.]|uniref:hybrid sensor histidine kinase/response regulator n=1 Tax=Ramlibacter sp. TaxID=1917967 RepID=UPI00262BC62D|nr:PAS domain-containing sensor histidine kinase [Ramlibacter sp.]MDB5955423.1 hybrid sensor histidine kinase/response regulator [Ramlibacter sp.]